MFYPVDSLRRGGRFYLCWLADSWPERFAAIPQRQLWSNDIRKLCDDLIKVMMNESGRPVNRFSLRLSSQLMRGLVRLYQRKVSLYLVDLCMTNASVFKHTNKKWQHNIDDVSERIRSVQALPAPVLQASEVPEETENCRQVAQLIENSGNIVANEQDITLKEAVIPEMQLPNDGFGEENPEQALRLALDWPVEAMLGADAPAQHVSAVSAALDVTDLDVSRAPADVRMELAAELDATMFNKSMGTKISTGPDFEKDVPDIPEIPIPDMSVPVPQAENQSPERSKTVEPKLPTLEKADPAQQIPDTPAEIELQELEEIPAKRRRKHKLIIDKNIIIESKVLAARINNPKVELRCDDPSEDLVPITIPVAHYFRRLAHAGYKYKYNISNELTRLFLRNLGVIPNQVAEEREMEELRRQLSHRRLPERSILERIEEESIIREKTPVRQPVAQPVEMSNVVEPTAIEQPIQAAIPDLPAMQPENIEPVDISDLPTQKLELSQAVKRKTDTEAPMAESKRPRLVGEKVFSRSQLGAKKPDFDINITENEKENIPMNQQSPIKSPSKSQRNVLSMLELAGIADVSEPRLTQTIDNSRRETAERSRTQKRDSEGSETPLGSLDRTKVSLGDSDKTTDSVRLIREQWGTVGTITKILKAIKSGADPITVWSLMASDPVLAEHKNVVAARCFNSILKLKQHGFIIVRKDPDTLEITNIILGPRFH